MTYFRQFSQPLNLVTTLGLVGASIFLAAQTPIPKSDANQITSLLARLSDHSNSPAEVLDPSLSRSDREENLSRFSAYHYELSLVPTEGGPTITGDDASVPIQVHYKADDGNSLDTGATVRFVRRNGTWYFSNFDFMRWPAFLIVVLVIGVIIGIGYAATVLLFASRLGKQSVLGIKRAKIFIPFFWPSLYRQTR